MRPAHVQTTLGKDVNAILKSKVGPEAHVSEGAAIILMTALEVVHKALIVVIPSYLE